MEKTDEELLRAYNSGDSKAFELLFTRHRDKIFNFALRMTGSRSDAEDVTSEVFLQLFHKRFQHDGRAKLSTWLFTVARNAAINRLRSARHMISFWTKKDDEQESHWDLPDPGGTPAQEIQRKERAHLVQKILKKLPPDQKDALILREYFDKDYEEISTILQCSLDNVKILIYRARQKLREELLPFITEGEL